MQNWNYYNCTTPEDWRNLLIGWGELDEEDEYDAPRENTIIRKSDKVINLHKSGWSRV